jgi:hypothetical protein
MARCCTFRFIDERGLRVGDTTGFWLWTKRSWALLSSISFREKVCRSGDFSGAVFARWSFCDRGTEDERGDGTGLLRVLGKSDSRGDGEGITGDVARR